MNTEVKSLDQIQDQDQEQEQEQRVVPDEVYIRTPLYTGPDRRQTQRDRRKLGFFSLRQLSLKGERKSHRRAEDLLEPYVDWYEPRLLFFVLGTLILACVDALLTIVLWSKGVIEINFLMMSLLSDDIQKYVIFKIALTSLALIVMVIYKDFLVYRLFKVYHLLYALFGIYFLVVLSEVLALL